MATTSAQIQQLYVAYLGRAADKAGLDYWSAQLNATNATLTLDDLRTNFTTQQAEYTDAYGGLSRSDTVIKIYNNLFGRAPDAAGLEYWTTGGGASVNADLLLTAFINGAASADAKVVANKVTVAEVYTSTAGANYAKADASSIIAGVDGTATSISTAVAKLEDGSLSGIAIPAGVGALKAAEVAAKAVTDFEASKVADLVALNKDLQDLAVKLDVDAVPDLTAAPSTGQTYANAKAAIANAKELRSDVSKSSTADLQDLVSKDAAAVKSTGDAFKVSASTGTQTNVDLANTLEKAVSANAALSKADSAAVTTATGKVQVDFAAADTGTALADANKAAGTNVKTTTELYAALTDGTKTADQNKAIVDAFSKFLSSSSDFNTLKTLAVTDYNKAVAVVNVQNAAKAISDLDTDSGDAYVAAVNKSVVDQTTLKNAQTADALVSKANAIDTADKALISASQDATGSVPKYVVDAKADAGTDGNDLFHFAAGVDSKNDFAIKFGQKDALYIGEGYTLNTTATLDATGIHGGANGTKEVFFFKDGTDVKAVIETADLGSSTVTGPLAVNANDGVSVITLTGVTDISQVSFSNGIISHVA